MTSSSEEGRDDRAYWDNRYGCLNEDCPCRTGDLDEDEECEGVDE